MMCSVSAEAVQHAFIRITGWSDPAAADR